MHPRLVQARELQSWMVTHRRQLHAEPEVGLELPDTTAYVVQVLQECGYQPEVHPGAGVTAQIPGRDRSRTPTVLRADMDALPVDEQTGPRFAEFASQRQGAMHACGHDLHMAMLLGAARAYADQPPAGDVVLVFQPGEETDRGAVPTLARHQSLQLEAASAFALHVHATWPPHSISYTRGTFMGYGDWFRIDFRGPGGHASQPHLAGNPIEAGARFVLAARALVETLSASEHLVATVTESFMGNTVNVIPGEGRLRGTIRTLSAAQRAALINGLRDAAARAAKDTDTEASFELMEGYPAVVNDGSYVDQMLTTLTATELGTGLTEMTQPSMVIEDFAYFLQRWPGAMVYLGANIEGHTAFNHAGDAVFDESVLATGAALHLMAGDGF
ncbi:M20 family metallopeptidase [Nocardioides sp. InS609-2]|uniref:M20 metallopeptidase family protein n=1 Tax=Nocardioides sp. InS609-2 TaxID=2760705 RepID=UPI0020BE731C|nr:M20 family metallopeptidase [Nocardioides sp. InS609-2]